MDFSYLRKSRDVGPWRCDGCGQLSQFAEIKRGVNFVYCKNEACRYQRIVDKRRSRIVENDGTVWSFDQAGNKWQVRARA